MQNKNQGKPVTFLDWLGINNVPNWRVARILGPILTVIFVLLFVGLFVGALCAAFRMLFGLGETTLGETTLGAGALIAAILGSPFLIWTTYLKTQALHYEKEGHITDRINAALALLGAEKTTKAEGIEKTEANLELRIGAILSLERIAQDSTTHDKGRDHVRVMEILCAYIRHNAPAPLGVGKKPYTDPRADIAIALEVLGRRRADQIAVERQWNTHLDPIGYRLDLSFANLQNTNLICLNFANSLLLGARLEGAYLWDTRLEGASLLGAHLEGAFLWNVDLSNLEQMPSQDELNKAYGDAKTREPEGYKRPTHWLK